MNLLIKDDFKIYMNGEYIKGSISVRTFFNADICDVVIMYKGEIFESSFGTSIASIEYLMEQTLENCLNRLSKFVIDYQLNSMNSEW